MRTSIPFLLLIALLSSGCHDDDPVIVGPDAHVPAPPRGVYSVTGDEVAYLSWLPNTEHDIAGYNVFVSECADGPDCHYFPVGSTTGLDFTVAGLTNGVTRFFAVAAFDEAGNESELSLEMVFDTPRPEGFNRAIFNALESTNGSGYDFSAFAPRAYEHPETDIYFVDDGGFVEMVARDAVTDIQDAGFANTLDAVDYAPPSGWSPTHRTELIVGHCYIVWTRDDHYAKFRVTEIRPSRPGIPAQVVFDWAYQVAQGNGELRAKRVAPAPVAVGVAP